MDRSVNIRLIAVTALMAALIFVLTRVVQIPTPAKGYIHLGDAGVIFSALAFGPEVAAIAGGVGTALADMTSGYPQWAIFSLVIHGLQGYVVGIIVRHETEITTLLLATFVSLLIVVVGYFFAGVVLMGAALAVLELLPNVIQGISGGVIGAPLYIAAARAYPPLVNYTRRSS
jgi:uncharacterized membrane protein